MREDLTERWLPIPGWEGRYEVSDQGRIRRPVVYLKGGRLPRGYRLIGLWRHNRAHHYLVHQLVLMAFVGTCPPGQEIDHIDGDPSNNRLENLEYVTRLENMTRSLPKRRATQVRGERSPKAKLSEADVREMRRLAADGVGYRALARRFGVAYPTARNVVLRERWAHIE